MSEAMPRLGLGALAGVLATVPMTAVMVGAQQLGLLGKAPPETITEKMLDPPPGTKRIATAFTHLGFGGVAGALFGALRRPRSMVRAAVEGAAFGTAVWAASYAGWVPALGILPPPSEDRADRQATMVVAHWVYGATLGMLVSAFGRLRRREVAKDPVAVPHVRDAESGVDLDWRSEGVHN
jgi:hypothetical protein